MQCDRYWNDTGLFSPVYHDIWDNHIPLSGSSPDPDAEIVRAVSKIYYDHYNNGGCNLDMQPFSEHLFDLVTNDSLKRSAELLEVTNFDDKVRSILITRKHLDEIMDVAIANFVFNRLRKYNASHKRKLQTG